MGVCGVISLSQLLSSVLAGAVLSVLLNLIRVLRSVSPHSGDVIRVGPWHARLSDGGPRMTAYQRALVAVTGLWAMRSSEAVYFTSLHDSRGERLRAGRSYLISGRNMPARWWSLTVYRNFQFIPNPWRRYSRSSTNLKFEADGTWKLWLTPHEATGNWMPIGADDGLLAISLRLYNPDDVVRSNAQSLEFPRIEVAPAAAITDASCIAGGDNA